MAELQDSGKREFCVDTPLGRLYICAKSDVDCADDYPGVYVSLLTDDEDVLLACVEYDSSEENLLTTVYDRNEEEPVSMHHHYIWEGDGNETC